MELEVNFEVKNTTWESVLHNPRLMEGEIEVRCQGGTTYRGPIKKVDSAGGDVVFHFLWCAEYNIRTDEWTAVERDFIAVFNKITTSVKVVVASGKIILLNDVYIMTFIFPEGVDSLDPGKVLDLDPQYSCLQTP